MRRTMLIPMFSVVLFGLMWLLVSCVPLREPRLFFDREGAPIVQDTGFDFIFRQARDIACTETVIQTDVAKVKNKPAANNHLVYWTWHMNFLDFPWFSYLQPFACFRMYGRESVTDEFRSIDGGGILITDCNAVGEVTFDTIERPYAIRDNQVISGVVGSGRATFANGGYIVCSNFSITRMAEMIRQNAQEYNVTEPISQALSQLGSTQVYSSLTVVATGYVTEAISSNPVFHYHPTDEAAFTKIDDDTFIDHSSVKFLLPSTDPSLVTFSALLDAKQYKPISSACNFYSHEYNQEEHFWWMDFAGYKDPGNRLAFLKHQIAYTLPTRLLPLDECFSVENVDVTVGAPVDPSSEITFWTGDSEIYIGCEWHQGECDSTFSGVLYSVLIDPLDSKPQS